MLEEDYPALYQAANLASIDAQRQLLAWYKINTFLLIIAALMTQYSGKESYYAIISATLFLLSLSVCIYSRSKNFHKRWYEARALSESIKTATWRLVMQAEPFNKQNKDENKEKFTNLLKELLIENRGMSENLVGNWSQKPTISQKMQTIIDATYEAKKDFYLKGRIDNQKNWYSKKSCFNYKASNIWFWCLCAVYILSILSLLIKIADPNASYLPTDSLAVVASSIIGWTQLKRFDDLMSSYSFTAHEIGIIESRYLSVSDMKHLSRFVSDAENAFSREHTQWAARRDY